MIRSNTILELITVTDECEKNKCLFCLIIFTCPQIYSGNSPFNHIVQGIMGMAMLDNWEDILIPISLNHNLTYFPLGGYKRHLEYIEYYSVTYPKTMTFVATPYADSIHEGFTSSTYSNAFTTFAPINDRHPHPRLGATIQTVSDDVNIRNRSIGEKRNQDTESSTCLVRQMKAGAVVWILKHVCDINSTICSNLCLREKALILGHICQCCMFT